MNAGGINLEKCLASCSGNNYKFGRAVVDMTVMQNLFSKLDFVPEICYHKTIYLYIPLARTPGVSPRGGANIPKSSTFSTIKE